MYTYTYTYMYMYIYIYISDSYICDRVYVYNPEALRPCRSLSWVSGRRSESAIRVSGSPDISLDSWRSFLETVLLQSRKLQTLLSGALSSESRI